MMCLAAFTVPAHGELVFHLDFGQDGAYEEFWPLEAGETTNVDVYVSYVPGEPDAGLGAMGFKVVYDVGKLEPVISGTEVYAGNWQGVYLDSGTPGVIHMAGFRTGTGISGNGIQLASLRFLCIADGTSELRILDRGADVDSFVLFGDPESPTVLDGEFADGIFLVAQIVPPTPGDVNGDKSVDLIDLIIALKTLGGMAPNNIHNNADVDGDAEVGLVEALYILRKAAKTR